PPNQLGGLSREVDSDSPYVPIAFLDENPYALLDTTSRFRARVPSKDAVLSDSHRTTGVFTLCPVLSSQVTYGEGGFPDPGGSCFPPSRFSVVTTYYPGPAPF